MFLGRSAEKPKNYFFPFSPSTSLCLSLRLSEHSIQAFARPPSQRQPAEPLSLPNTDKMARTAFIALACGMLGAASALEVVTPADGDIVVSSRCVFFLESATAFALAHGPQFPLLFWRWTTRMRPGLTSAAQRRCSRSVGLDVCGNTGVPTRAHKNAQINCCFRCPCQLDRCLCQFASREYTISRSE